MKNISEFNTIEKNTIEKINRGQKISKTINTFLLSVAALVAVQVGNTNTTEAGSINDAVVYNGDDALKINKLSLSAIFFRNNFEKHFESELISWLLGEKSENFNKLENKVKTTIAKYLYEYINDKEIFLLNHNVNEQGLGSILSEWEKYIANVKLELEKRKNNEEYKFPDYPNSYNYKPGSYQPIMKEILIQTK